MKCAVLISETGNIETYQIISDEPCLDTVILTQQEYSTTLNIMQSLFDFGYYSTSELTAIFVFFFSLPLVVYLVAWAYQEVINFATKH